MTWVLAGFPLFPTFHILHRLHIDILGKYYDLPWEGAHQGQPNRISTLMLRRLR